MVLLEEYYELHEAVRVSRFWKVIHIVFYICAAGLGIWCGLTIALLRIAFDDKCFLFSKIRWKAQHDLDSLSDKATTETGTFGIIGTNNLNEETIWSDDTVCEFCQYTMVSSFITATFWAAFFLMCGNGGKSQTGLPQPWRIVLPAMIFNFFYFIIAFWAALQIQQGTNAFCNTNEDFGLFELHEKCPIVRIYDKEKAKKILIWLEIVNETSWLTAGAWFVSFLIPLLRILFVSDFTVCKISVYKVDELLDDSEEVMRVVTYEGRRVHFQEKLSPGNQLHED